MDLTEMREKMVLDLKMVLDTDISTAEANRCIQRAVDDLSRRLPREKVYEVTYKNTVTDDSFVSPAAQSDTSIVNAADISASVDGATLTLASRWNDIPRPVKVTLTDANNSITRLTVIVKGTDPDGAYIEERFYRANGKTQTGKLYFFNITEVELNEIAGNGAADTLSVGTGVITGVWIELDNPVHPDSESIYSGAGSTGTQYTKDTDFEMDFTNGKVALKSGGAMVADTTYYANYTKSKTNIDISAIIPEVLRIGKVLYPAKETPEKSVAFSIWKSLLTIGSQAPKESQTTLGDGNHIAIFYECRQSPPTEQYGGSYPEYLDQVVLVGAGAYVLLVEALQYELASVTDLASARTALTNATKYLNNNTNADAAGILQDITDDITNLRTAIATALDAMNAYLDLVATDLTSSANRLVAITTDAASLRTAINTAVDAMNAYLDSVAADLTSSTNKLTAITTDAASLRTAINVAVDAMNAYLDEVDTTDFGQATEGAEALTQTGRPLINVLNTGERVPDLYAQYSQARIIIAQARLQSALAYGQEAIARLQNLATYIQESTGYNEIGHARLQSALAYGQEAQARLQNLNTYIQESNSYTEIGHARLQAALAYGQEAQSRLQNIATYIQQAQGYDQIAQDFLNEANQYQSVANIAMLIADRYRTEAQLRMQEFNQLLDARAEYRRRVVSVPVIQPK